MPHGPSFSSVPSRAETKRTRLGKYSGRLSTCRTSFFGSAHRVMAVELPARHRLPGRMDSTALRADRILAQPRRANQQKAVQPRRENNPLSMSGSPRPDPTRETARDRHETPGGMRWTQITLLTSASADVDGEGSFQSRSYDRAMRRRPVLYQSCRELLSRCTCHPISKADHAVSW